ncbi:ribulose-phosphate 3-epimerase [Spiroplasma litorale]|uniref:Ribulose-phosphate 3-epimerase n=1 Tax=Spiroplasma litorale TaxID=216942 RepID=A0A0K1W105_9MOLU|nr:ribulose-phosphate 3-epimerase [Spiroplasma litorale]AKX33848.1 ribulose-phosphate 3-epimerase [Spiroplasma litorale]
MKKTIAAASILTADFLNLKLELDKLWKANIKWIHYDVMDYNFVPNLSFGPKILSDITNFYDFNIDIHFMVRIDEKWNINDYLNSFMLNNVKQFTFHIESLNDSQINEVQNFCLKNRINFSLAINPNTSIERIEKYFKILDNILVMSVQPGFGGQKFIEDVIIKIKDLKNIKNKNNYSYTIEIDGGINQETYKIAKEAGVDILVAGSYLVNKNITQEELFERVNQIEK